MPQSRRSRLIQVALILALLLLFPLKDNRPPDAQDAYDHAWLLFQHGRLADSEEAASSGYRQFGRRDPQWAANFRLLQAEVMLWRGTYDGALKLLSSGPDPTNPQDEIRRLLIEALALSHQRQNEKALTKLNRAVELCQFKDYLICGDLLRAQGIIAVRRGLTAEGRDYFLSSLAFAQSHHDAWLQVNASLNIGWTELQSNHFDEAVDWSGNAYRDAKRLGAEDLTQVAASNLGWAYLQLGDSDRALERFTEAEESARSIGNVRDELKWITDEGYVYRDTGDLSRAADSYRQAYKLAKQVDSKDENIYTLEDLAQISVDSGKLEEATSYIDQVKPMEIAGGGHLSPSITLTEGMLAAARKQDQLARSLFLNVQADPSSPTTTRLAAGYELALLFEAQGNNSAAEKRFKSTLAAFDSAQAELKSEESKLPFVANAAHIYDDYIQLLIRQHRSEDALRVADQSRARTLTQALGPTTSKTSTIAINPRQVAQKANATLLFYWLSNKQSYLWTITPAKVVLVPLPPQQQIATQVDRYNKYLLNLHDPLTSSNQDAQSLYKTLIAPAAQLIHPNQPVMILADGVLNQLNFETLLAPGPSKTSEPHADESARPSLHYLIEDATLLSAPSLAMLAAARPVPNADRSLLLFGNPISASEDYPALPLFGYEMTRIRKHFDAPHIAAFDGAHATPAAYLSSNPSHYSYIHFVSHAIASRTDPLDSAIILSSSNAAPKTDENSFKLYARDIMQHPISARLVTISACYTSGTRAYAGEGLVGLSWAFMRAGAQSVIGALWEVSDDSTPQLMDDLYKDLAAGDAPAVALRKAKLDLMHTQDKFRVPFYWAPFQIYTTR